MSNAPDRVEFRRSRPRLVLFTIVGISLLMFGIWDSGILGWLIAGAGTALASACVSYVLRNRPRLTVSKQGIEWPGQALGWGDVVSISEFSFGLWRWQQRRWRFLAIRTVRPRKGTRRDRFLFHADFTLNISALESSADAVLEIVEKLSGRSVERTR